MFLASLSLQERSGIVRLAMAMQIETGYHERRQLINVYKLNTYPCIFSDASHGGDQYIAKLLREGHRIIDTVMLSSLFAYTCQTFRFNPETTEEIRPLIFQEK